MKKTTAKRKTKEMRLLDRFLKKIAREVIKDLPVHLSKINVQLSASDIEDLMSDTRDCSGYIIKCLKGAALASAIERGYTTARNS